MKSQTFGEKIKELRLQHGYSLKYVGNAINYNAKSLSKIERNEKKAPQHIIKSLALLYNLHYKELIVKYLSEEIYYRLHTFEYAQDVLRVVEKRLEKEDRYNRVLHSREAIIETLRQYFADKPVEKAWIFGSFARDVPASLDSDIDIMVTFKRPHKISLFDLIQMREELSRQTGRTIDLVEEGQELKSFSGSIQKEKMLVYGGQTR